MTKEISAVVNPGHEDEVLVTWDYDESLYPGGNAATPELAFCGSGSNDVTTHHISGHNVNERSIVLDRTWFSPETSVDLLYYDNGASWLVFMSFSWPSASDPVDPPPTSFPTDWSYITGHAPGSTGPFVTGFAIAWVPDQLNLSWDTFTGASHYKLQVRHSLATTFLELALVSQATGPVQGFVLVDWADDARFMPGQDYVFRVRVED